MNEDFESLADQALEEQYKEIKLPVRTQLQKMRDLVRESREYYKYKPILHTQCTEDEEEQLELFEVQDED